MRNWVLGAAAAVMVSAPAAHAAWSLSSTPTSAGRADAGALQRPSSMTAPRTAFDAVDIAFDAPQPTAGTHVTVVRNDGVRVCTRTTASGVCSDTSVAPKTTYTYTASAALHHWTGPGRQVIVTTPEAPPFTPVGLEVLNGQGNTAGTVESGDQIIVTFSVEVSPRSYCATMPQSGDATLTGVVVSFSDQSAATGNHDSFTVSGACGEERLRWGVLNFGTQQIINGSGGLQFAGSTLAWHGASKTWTLTLGAHVTGNAKAFGSTPVTTMTYTPDASLADVYGQKITGTAQRTAQPF